MIWQDPVLQRARQRQAEALAALLIRAPRAVSCLVRGLSAGTLKQLLALAPRVHRLRRIVQRGT